MDFFPEDSTITVDANELQQLIRDKQMAEVFSKVKKLIKDN